MPWLERKPDVVCTELEDGAVLLNMDTRLYYSLNDVGLEVWNLVEAAGGPEEVAGKLTGTFEVDEETARQAVSRFVQELEQERLVGAASGDRTATEAPPAAARPQDQGARRPFAQPELVRHDEPLHEVSTSPFDPQLPLAE